MRQPNETACFGLEKPLIARLSWPHDAAFPLRAHLRRTAGEFLRARCADPGLGAPADQAEPGACRRSWGLIPTCCRPRKAPKSSPASVCPRAPIPSPWPMPATSSAISCRSSATAAPSCSAKSSTRTASAATSSSRAQARPRSRAGATAAPRSGLCLREYIVSEAMAKLGIPTTRSLAAVVTGENVMRETMLPGAVLTRVASSHIRVGTFQFFAARGDTDGVRRLADHVIARHYPDLAQRRAALSRAARCGDRAPGRPRRALASGRLHPWRDEHRQHLDLGRDHRLRPLRLHGRIQSRRPCSRRSTRWAATPMATSRASRCGI